MSENSTPEERTEMPTSRRMSKLREEGQLFHSQDLVHALSLFTGFTALSFISPLLYRDLQTVFAGAFRKIAKPGGLAYNDIQGGMFSLLALIGPHILIFGTLIALVASLGVFLQTGFNVKKKKLHFRFNMLNPLTGLQRMVSPHNFLMTLKAMLKLVMILPVAYWILKSSAHEMISVMHLSIPQLISYSGQLVDTLFYKIFMLLVLFAAFDWGYGKWHWLRNNKMTKEEVKDEAKSVEGDEATKKRIIQKGLQRIMQRIMQSVPKADVVVTNPTHYAVALRYDKGSMDAPTVVAKGKDFMAARIKEIARESGVPVLERKALARALYGSVSVGSTIPKDLFRAVAEVLAYVYKIRRKNPFAAKATEQRVN